MSFTPGSGAIIILGVDGAAASQRDIESVADALRRLNDADFRRLNGQISGVQEHMGKLRSVVAGVFTAVVAGLSIAAFGNMVTGAIEAAGSMNDLAIQTGASAAALMKFKTIGATSDTTIESIAGAMNKLAKGMAVSNEESKGLGQALKAIGVDFNSLKRMAPEQQMLTVASAMDQFQDGTGKAAVAMTLYGKEGAKMLPFLKDLADEAGNVTAALTAQEIEAKKALAAMADNFGDNITKIKLASAESKKAIALGMLPALYEASEAFLKVTGEAGGLKDTIARLSKDGTIAEWTRTGVTGLTYLMDAFQILARVTQSVFKIIGGSLTVTGTTFAGLANAMVLFIRGEYTQSWEMMKETAAKNVAAVKGTVAGIADVFSDSTFGSKIRSSMAALKGVGAAAAEAKKQVDYSASDDSTAKKSKEQSAYEALILSIREKVAAGQVEMSGYKQLSESQQLTIKLDELVRAGKIANVKANLDVARTLIAEREGQESVIESQKRAAAGGEAMAKVWKEYTDAQAKSIDEATKGADENEKLVATFGMTKGAIEGLELARLEEQLAQRASLGLTLDEIEALEKLIVAKRRGAAAAATLDGLEEQKKMWESVDKTAHDTFVSIFDSGKSAFDRLRDTLKNGLLDLLYQMTVKKWIFNITASITGTAASGVVQAATGGAGGAGSALSSIGTLGSLTSGVGLLGAGGLGLQAGYGALMSGGLAGIGGAVSGGIAAIGAGTASSIAAGLGTIAGALGPIALGIGAAVAIWKKFDTSGTQHTGGAALATSAGAQAINSSYIGFNVPVRSAQVDTMTASLASGIVSILDSTALSFGKTAGYTAATAFADDSSRDGAWGALLITKLGEKVLNWQDTQTSRWAPKEFADGAAGQEQYLAALSSSVRTALDSIGLPQWATTMLNNLGSGASIDRIATVVDQINQTQSVLKMMGDSLVGFAQMGDKATSALIAASGGIDTLATSASAYYQNFYSETERSAGTVQQLAQVIAGLGVAVPSTREQYRALVESQMALGEAGAPVVAMLLKLSASFAEVHPQVEATAAVIDDMSAVLAERADLQKQLDSLTMSASALLEKQRDALDASNRALFDQVQAATAAKKAQDAAKSSLSDVISRMSTFADSARALHDSLLTGNLSTLTPEEQYAETKQQYEQTLAAARAGDERAQGRFAEAANAFLTVSQKLNSGDAQYSADMVAVLQASDEAAYWAQTQADVAQASLDAMSEQVAGIHSVNATLQAIAQGIASLPVAMNSSPVPTFDTSINYAEMGRLDMAPLVAEVKALREELRSVRADQQQQTADLINRNDLATREAADVVVAGFQDAVVDGAWAAGRPPKKGPSA